MRLKIALVALLVGCTSTQSARDPHLFAFHNNFWLNLHHFARAVGRGMPARGALSINERLIWDAGVDFYRKNYSDRDLLFDDGMIAIKTALRAYEGKPSLDGAPIDPELRATLERLAPIYWRIWWTGHQASNRAWIEAAQPLVRAHGRLISERVAAAYGVKWPSEPIPVDLTVSAGPVGAYTTSLPTHTTIASTDPGYQGLNALEMLFHEASHAWGRPLQKAILQSAEARHKKVPPQLWHAVLFYNAGELTRRTLKEHGIDYVEVASRGTLYRDLCGDGCRERVAAAWDRRLNGSASMDEALDALVASWPD